MFGNVEGGGKRTRGKIRKNQGFCGKEYDHYPKIEFGSIQRSQLRLKEACFSFTALSAGLNLLKSLLLIE